MIQRAARLMVLSLWVAACSDRESPPDGGHDGSGGSGQGGGTTGGVAGSGGSDGGTGGLVGRGGGATGGTDGAVGGAGDAVGGTGGGSTGGVVGGTGGSVAGTVGEMAGIGGCGDRGGQGGVLVSPCPLCSTAEVANVIEACIVADSGAPLTMSVSADVTVTSITDVAGGNCQRVDRSSTGDMTKRLVLQPASGPSWTVFLRVPNLPATLISANDTLELSVTASTGGFLTPGEAEQTIALARDGQLIAFGVAGGSNLPILDSFGIEVSDAGAVCRVERCANVAHGTRIAVGSAQATIDQGRTAEVGNLSFTVEEHSRWYSNGGCDGYDRTRMGGYLTP